MASDTGDGGWGVAAYTAQFGNGVSATISAEEARRTNVWNSLFGVSFNGANPNSYGDFRFPDIVGNVRVDQAWGTEVKPVHPARLGASALR
jgi:Porin subfamily